MEKTYINLYKVSSLDTYVNNTCNIRMNNGDRHYSPRPCEDLMKEYINGWVEIKNRK